jgi:Flp pilus assembly protein TadD
MLEIKTRGSARAAAAAQAEPPLIDRLNGFLERGQYEPAYPLLTELCRQQEQSLGLRMTAGLVAIKLEKPAEAAAHFEHALRIAPDDYDANYNAALAALVLGEHESALRRLRFLRRLQPQNAELLHDMAVIWTSQGRVGRALGAYARAMRIAPNDSDTRNRAMQYCLENRRVAQARTLIERQQKLPALTTRSRAEANRWLEIMAERSDAAGSVGPGLGAAEPAGPAIRGARVAVFASHRMFLKDIVTSLSRENEVRIFDGQTVEQMRDLMLWADVAWFEWCDQLLIEAAKLPKTCRMVCRLHSYEAFTDMPARVDWSKVDHLVFVNVSVRELVRAQVKTTVASSVIHNGVDLDRFTVPADKPVTRKIASVGYINYKKNPTLLLYCFQKIHQYDSRYSLHIAGSHQDPRIELYFNNYLRRHPLPVFFDGWVEDMPAWYADKSFVISTSLFESFHYSIAEGMAAGLLPLIHDWFGADKLYPAEYLYGDPDSCLALLRRLEAAEIHRKRVENRAYIGRRYSQVDRTADIAALLQSVVAQTALKNGVAVS